MSRGEVSFTLDEFRGGRSITPSAACKGGSHTSRLFFTLRYCPSGLIPQRMLTFCNSDWFGLFFLYQFHTACPLTLSTVMSAIKLTALICWKPRTSSVVPAAPHCVGRTR